MTVSSTTKKTSGQGNASETLFAIGNIAFTDNADLDVWIRDTGESPPTETLKTISTHYFITNNINYKKIKRILQLTNNFLSQMQNTRRIF